MWMNDEGEQFEETAQRNLGDLAGRMAGREHQWRQGPWVRISPGMEMRANHQGQTRFNMTKDGSTLNAVHNWLASWAVRTMSLATSTRKNPPAGGTKQDGG